MAKTLTYKILESHLVEGRLEKGEEIGIRIDQTLTQDATGTMAYLQFEAMEIDRVKTELSVSYVDHNTLQMGFENMDDHKYLMTMNRKFGIKYSRAGNGICHQVHLERFGAPGLTLLGSDSHTPTGGGIGMIAIGAGGLDVAVAMGGGPFFLSCPKVINVRLTGKMRPWVAAKDVILKVLEILSTKGNVGCVAEYTGPGVLTLSVPERATITNMGAELGVTTSVFPSDEMTRLFLKAQGRENVYQPLAADEGAEYERIVEIDLSTLEPMIACPHSPDNIKKVKDIAGLKVDQVAVGSCTNSSYRDLMVLASILKGKKVHPELSMIVAPGSRQVFEMISRNGALADIISAGARVMESACGFCIGSGQAPSTNGISLRTNNRNFEGRSGTRSGQVYLCSVETAALSAISGVLVDPLAQSENAYPSVTLPDTFLLDDSMVLEPDFSGDIFRGPNIGNPPFTDPLLSDLKGIVNLKVGDKITTDHIMPAGTRLKYRSNIPEYAKYVFEGVDAAFAERTLADKGRGVYTAIVSGESYGQGSSREHAAICPMYLGVRAVVAKSFERIHAANLVNFGIVPLTFVNPADYDVIKQGDAFAIDGILKAVQGDATQVDADFGGKKIALQMNFSRRQRDILVAGGLLNYTKKA